LNSFWQVRYCAREALANIRRHPWPSLVAVSSIGALLFLAGVSAWTWMNFERLAASWQEKARLIVYLRDDAPIDQIEAIAKALEVQKEVKAVHFVTKDEAMSRMRESLDGQQDILEGLQENPLPASYEVTLKPEARRLPDMEKVAGSVKGLPGVDDVEYGKPWLAKLDAISNVGRAAGVIGLTLLAAALVLIINNNSKLSLYARLEELEVFKLVGASPMLLQGPYVMEGAFKGLAGGVVAAVALLVLQATVGTRYGVDLRAILGFWPSAGLAWALAGGAASGGFVLGIIGGATSVSHVVRRLP
jgi:cell division transport system permease protein